MKWDGKRVKILEDDVYKGHVGTVEQSMSLDWVIVDFDDGTKSVFKEHNLEIIKE